jgi:hypothetical protein
MIAAIRDWRGWIWPLIAGSLVLAITAAGVLTAPEKVETRAQLHPPAYVKAAALQATRLYGGKKPRAVEWIVTTHDLVATAMKLKDDRPVYKRDCLILVQGDFSASPGTPPKKPGQQRSSWLALLYTAGKTHVELGVVGAYAARPVTKALPALKRYEW